MPLFKATVKHDKGTDIFNIAASSEEAARKMITRAEGCPDHAIVKLTPVKGITVTTYGDEKFLFDNDQQTIITHL